MASSGSTIDDATIETARPSNRRWLRHRVWPIMRLVLLAILIGWVVLMGLENRMIFFPTKHPDGADWTGAGLKFEDAWITTADGVRIHGWYLPVEKPRAYVVFAHGNAGNITHRDDLMHVLQKQLNVSALFFDYRGYGRSEGSPSGWGILADARAARKWLAEKVGVPEQQIVLMAESIGTGVMVDLAANDGARGLVLENAFTSLPDVAADAMPFLPVRWLMRTRLNSESLIGKYHGPLLQVHGAEDSIIPFKLGRRLFAAANEPKRFVEIPGGDHNDPRTPLFFRELDKFLDELPPPSTDGKGAKR
jgi:fermentation-respiration switch protein FrsA (DUF1100 family)